MILTDGGKTASTREDQLHKHCFSKNKEQRTIVNIALQTPSRFGIADQQTRKALAGSPLPPTGKAKGLPVVFGNPIEK